MSIKRTEKRVGKQKVVPEEGGVMANCNIDPEVWFDYAEGEVNPDFKKDLSLHLKDCKQCQVSYAEYRWIRTGVRKSIKADEVKLPSEKAFDRLHDQIMAKVARTSVGAATDSDSTAEVRRIGPITPFWVRRIAIPMAAAAALVLIIIGSLVTTPGFKSSTNSFAKQDNIEEQFIEQTASSNPNALDDSMMTSQDEDEMVLDAAAAKLSRMSDTEARTMLDNMK